MLRGMADDDDVLKGAGRVFAKLGSKVKDAGSSLRQTTKQVTGLGRGGVRLELDRARIAPGSVLRGRIVLALDEPVEAKRLVVSLHARQKVVTVGRDGSGRTVGTSHADVYRFDCELNGSRGYESSTVAFELAVPPDALDLRPSAGANPIADAFRAVASALSPSAGPIEWRVIGRLEIAWGRDLSHELDIVVAR